MTGAGAVADAEVERWLALVDDARRTPKPPPLDARLILGRVGGPSRSARVRCGPRTFVVKGIRNDRPTGRMLFADHVVGLLAQVMGAPVPPVALVRLSSAQLQSSSAVHGILDPIVHGSENVPNVRENTGILFPKEPEHGPRFASLAVLFGWAHGQDHQFLFEVQPPHLVHSHDHGEFFPGGPRWSEVTLASDPGPVGLDRRILALTTLHGVSLTGAMIRSAIEQLSSVTDNDLAQVVATPPDSWGVTVSERVAVARFLARRRDALLAHMRGGG